MKKGFTLVEVVVSIAIIAILILSIASLNMSSIRTNKMVRQKDNAYNIAKAICEMYKSDNDCSYVPGSTTVHINSIDDIKDINTLITSPDTDASKKYIVLIEFTQTDAAGDKPVLLVMHVTVTNNDSDKKTVKMMEAKVKTNI